LTNDGKPVNFTEHPDIEEDISQQHPFSVSIPKKIPRSTNQKRALDSKSSIQSPLLQKKIRREAIAPVPTNFQGGFTALKQGYGLAGV